MIPGHAIKLAGRIFSDSRERESFLACLGKSNTEDPAVVWTRGLPQDLALAEQDLLPIQPDHGQPLFVWKLSAGVRAGKSIWHREGQIYCLDYSSVLEMFPLNSVKETSQQENWKSLSLIDVCASPGGKSILSHLWVLPSFHLANEVDSTRAFTLKKNLERVGLTSIQVESQTAEDLAQGQQAELVLVDAPCSGQSLIARGEKNLGAFHPASINGNSNRQRRILAESSRMVVPGGFLLYSTCTYSFEENEKVIRWFLKQSPQFSTVEVPTLSKQRSELLKDFCYRFFPHRGEGAGGFTCLLRRQRA